MKTAELQSLTKCLKIDTQEASFRNKEKAINSRGGSRVIIWPWLA